MTQSDKSLTLASGVSALNTSTPDASTPNASTLDASSEAPSCEQHLVNLDRVRQVQPDLMSIERAQQMAEFLGVLADPTRLRLLSALAQQELCVCDLAATTKMGESAVSHQLRVLRTARLVKYRREGRNIYYSLADHHVINLYNEVVEHLMETAP